MYNLFRDKNYIHTGRANINLRGPCQFFVTLKGPKFDIKRMKGNYNAFRAWRCQWDAFVSLSGIKNNFLGCYPQDTDNNTTIEYSKLTQENSEKHLLSALYSVMTSDTLQIISSMDGLRKGKDLNAEVILGTIESFVAASEYCG